MTSGDMTSGIMASGILADDGMIIKPIPCV